MQYIHFCSCIFCFYFSLSFSIHFYGLSHIKRSFTHTHTATQHTHLKTTTITTKYEELQLWKLKTAKRNKLEKQVHSRLHWSVHFIHWTGIVLSCCCWFCETIHWLEFKMCVKWGRKKREHHFHFCLSGFFHLLFIYFNFFLLLHNIFFALVFVFIFTRII